MADVFERVLLPVASRDDARASALALGPYVGDSVIAVNVIEKAGGAPDKASVEQRKAEAEAMFDIVHEELDDLTDVETSIRYGTDVAETIFAAADDQEEQSVEVRRSYGQATGQAHASPSGASVQARQGAPRGSATPLREYTASSVS